MIEATSTANTQPLQTQKRGVHAQLKARFATRIGRTQLVHAECKAPLKIAKFFTRDDDSGALDVCVMDVSPGFFSGDAYDLQWHLERGARVLARTQSFQRAHQMPHGKATQSTRVSIAESALLHLAPQPLLLYRDAEFANSLDVEIACGGAFISSEIFCAGRVAHGEIFAFRRYENRVEVRYDGALCFCAQNVFTPQKDASWRAAAWQNFTHCGTILAFGKNLNESVLEEVRGVLREYSHIVGGASTLQNGIAVSALGNHAWTLQNAFSEIAKKLEETLLIK
jgi:urease accessory protein